MKHFIKACVDSLKKLYVNSTNDRKVKYLKGRGASVGIGTRFVCGIECFGSEPYLISVGDDCLFSSDVMIFTHDGGVKVLNSLKYFEYPNDKMGRVKIGNNVFIGHGTIILPNVVVGDNVIVGAGSIVSKDLPHDTVCAGSPAKPICSLDEYYTRNCEKKNFYDFKSLGVGKKDFFTRKKTECR